MPPVIYFYFICLIILTGYYYCIIMNIFYIYSLFYRDFIFFGFDCDFLLHTDDPCYTLNQWTLQDFVSLRHKHTDVCVGTVGAADQWRVNIDDRGLWTCINQQLSQW